VGTHSTSLLQKLTFVVLVAILGCLVVIVAQNRNKSSASIELPPESQEEASLTESDTSPVAEATVAPEPIPVIIRPRLVLPSTNNAFRPVPRTPAVPPAVAVVQPTVVNPVERIPLEFENSVSPLAPVGFVTPPLSEVTSPGIRGRITLIGTPPPEIPIDLGTVCGPAHPQGTTTRHYLVSPEGGLANVFVYIQEGLEKMKFSPQEQSPVLDNVGCFFEPYVMGVQAGQPFFVRNLDPFMHTVRATPTANKVINAVLAVQGQISQKSFAVPESSIRIKCDVHSWMFAYVHVVSHPYFAVSDRDGSFQLPPNLPAGNYLLTALHQKAGPLRKRISVGSNEAKTVDFVFHAPTRFSRL
jgi:hypothetical protein